MLHAPILSTRRAVAVTILMVGALLAAGCGSGIGTVYPVSGTITVGDEPLTAKTANVLFKPDAAKGNTTAYEPAGKVDEQGHYTLYTNGQAGAPPGWYKVVVTAHDDPVVHPKTTRRERPVARSLLAPKYGQADKTDLAIEVVANPASGAYDLKLSK
jgi:hypothetical protein